MKLIQKVMILFLVFFSIQCVACQNDVNQNMMKDENVIRLTENNLEEFVYISCSVNGLASTYENGKYSYITGTVICKGKSGYKFENATIYIKIIFDDGRNYADPEIAVKLDKEGYGADSQNYAIFNKKYECLAYATAYEIRVNSYYRIESAYGKVKIEKH